MKRLHDLAVKQLTTLESIEVGTLPQLPIS